MNPEMKVMEFSRCCSRCWHAPERPCPQLVECLATGPLCHEDEECAGARAAGNARLRREGMTRPVIYIGTGTCGLGAGAGKTLAAIRRYLEAHPQLDAQVVEVGCIGLCVEEPLVDVQLPRRTRLSFPGGDREARGGAARARCSPAPPRQSRRSRSSVRRALAPSRAIRFLDEHPFFAPQTRWVLANCGRIDPGSLEEYLARGGYSGLSKALRGLTPSELCDSVERSGLRGRGGGGFPTGRKWKVALTQPADQKYMVCNADEGDPGAFMDRAVIEGDPHRLLEGLALAAYAIGATKAYIYIRAEYPLAIARLQQAIAQARAFGLLGQNILDSGFSLEIALKQGAGRVRVRRGDGPPAQHRGPAGHATSPAALPRRARPVRQADGDQQRRDPREHPRHRRAGRTSGSRRSGRRPARGRRSSRCRARIANTGLVEVAMGTTLRQIVFDIGGGIPEGKAYKAVQIGGPSGGCIPTQKLDIEIDYESLKTVGAMMGSGGLVVMDEGTCMVDVAKFFMDFIQRESCGKCIPCREGTRRMLEILQSLTRSRRNEQEIESLERFRSLMNLEHLANVIRDTSLCGLGQSAPNPVLSTLRWFRERVRGARLRPALPGQGVHGAAHLHDRPDQVHRLRGLRQELLVGRDRRGVEERAPRHPRALHRVRDVRRDVPLRRGPDGLGARARG